MNLKALRQKQKLTREALAEKVGCSAQQIYNFENNRATIPAKYLSAYAKALKVGDGPFITFVLRTRNARFLKG